MSLAGPTILWLNGTHGVGETAHRIEYAGGTLVMPMTVVVEPYWWEISQGLASYAIPVHHLVPHADQEVLEGRIQNDAATGYSSFHFSHLAPTPRLSSHS